MSFQFMAVIRHIKRSIKYEWKIGFQYVPIMTSVTLQVQQGAARCSKVQQGAARCSKVQHGLQETEGQVFRIALAPRLSKLLPVIPRTSGNFVRTCPAKQLLSKRAM